MKMKKKENIEIGDSILVSQFQKDGLKRYLDSVIGGKHLQIHDRTGHRIGYIFSASAVDRKLVDNSVMVPERFLCEKFSSSLNIFYDTKQPVNLVIRRLDKGKSDLFLRLGNDI